MAATWPDRRLLDLFGISVPIVQAPMAGAQGAALAAAVGNAGGLGSVACSLLDDDAVRAEVTAFRSASRAPLNLNFFCHVEAASDSVVDEAWNAALTPYYAELGLGTPVTIDVRIPPFDAARCDLVEELAPDVVSFHFGLPDDALVARVRASGAKVIASATTVPEAAWLEAHGCDAVIAQGADAGGHSGMFLRTDPAGGVGTLSLVPQVADAVGVPVIAAGGITDARAVAAAVVLGASGVQVGTAYLRSPEATIGPLHRAALGGEDARTTAVTNVLTGRPARAIVNRLMREVGPVSELAPPFPRAAGGVAPLRAAAEGNGDAWFTSMWAGQAAPLAVEAPAAEVTRRLAEGALALLA
jgi:nitronate monooxygenase